MFIITAKVRKGRIVAVAAAAAVVCGVLVAAAGLLGGRGAAASAAVSPKGVRTNEDRIAYLAVSYTHLSGFLLAGQREPSLPTPPVRRAAEGQSAPQSY